METINKHQNINNKEIINKINSINEQISIRESIPIYQRTEKQQIKLDNLLYELKQLQQLISKDDY